FSLGVILFECLTGRKAFLSADPEQKRQLILAGAVPRLRDVSPELPPGLDDVLRRACAVDPAARFQTVQELWAAVPRAPRPVAIDPAAPASAPTRQMSMPPMPSVPPAPPAPLTSPGPPPLAPPRPALPGVALPPAEPTLAATVIDAGPARRDPAETSLL